MQSQVDVAGDELLRECAIAHDLLEVPQGGTSGRARLALSGNARGAELETHQLEARGIAGGGQVRLYVLPELVGELLLHA